jgi:hypothetical protein
MQGVNISTDADPDASQCSLDFVSDELTEGCGVPADVDER